MSRQNFPVVGIGASAGGLDALRRLLDAMPKDPGVAIVIIQHLARDKASLTAELLERHTSMDVRQVADQPVVTPGNVYVIPPGQLLSIVDGRLQLTEMEGPRRPPIAVDFFFRSLAEDQKQCAVGVILSGTGSDGTLGVKAIKQAGGLVLAQDARTAEHSGMPDCAIRSGVVDQVLAPEAIPQALVNFASHDYICGDGPDEHDGPEATGTGDRAVNGTDESSDQNELVDQAPAGDQAPEGIDAIIDLLRKSGSGDFRNYKLATLLRRTRRRMCLHHIDTVENYLDFLKADPDEIQQLAGDLLISVTDFFRDREAWDQLADNVIPAIVKGKSGDDAVRVWVAGCATGEEAYTVAMLALEEIGKQEKACSLQVFASDVDKSALEDARAGQYPVSIVADVSPDRLQRFFKLQDGDLHYQVNKSLRETIVFAEQNLLSDPPFSQLDLILCRNVLIYLKPEVQQNLIGLFHFTLRRHGYLMLGSAETIGRCDDLFKTCHKRSRIYQAIGPKRYDRLELPDAPSSSSRKNLATNHFPLRREKQISHLAQEKLLDMLSPRAIVVDRHWRMLYISGDVNPFIQHKPGVQDDDLLSKIREGLKFKVRSAVHQAFAEKSNVGVRCRLERNGKSFPVRIEVRYLAARDQDEEFAMIVFDEPTTEPPAIAPESSAQASGTNDDVESDAIIRQLEEELAATKEDLQSSIEQFDVSNEEFKASSEEVMSINEELQSTNEELETSKEELQSLNEELSTVNLQLASKVEELEVKHADLENLISATDVATICLGTDLTIRWFTPAIRRVIRVQKSDIGRPLEDLQHDFENDALSGQCEQVLEQLTPIDSEVDCGDGRAFIRRIVPYRTDEHRVGGVVITMAEITVLRKREQQLLVSQESLRNLARNLEDQIRERTELLAILQHVTRVANESVSVADALSSSLAKVTEFNGWFVGHVWRLVEGHPDEEPRMESSGIWHVGETNHPVDHDSLQEFQSISGKLRIARGEGLIGRVMQSAKPEWINDIRNAPDPRFHRAGGLGLRAMIAYPIMILSEVVAVMEFFADKAFNPQAQFLAIIPDIGIQLGHAINRTRLQSAVARIADAQQRRIGRELHDGIAQQLTGGAMIAQSLKRALPETMPREIESVNYLIEILNQTHHDVRDLSSGLMPDLVHSADLIPALRGLAVATSERFNIQCQCHHTDFDESTIHNDGTANLIFQIASEAVHNAVKHAGAGEIEIRVQLSDNFRLSVHDDGKGFDTHLRKANTNGLRIMRYRAESVGGRLDIESSAEFGTKVLLTIPTAAVR